MLVVRGKKVSLTAFSSPAVDAIRIDLANNSRKYTSGSSNFKQYSD